MEYILSKLGSIGPFFLLLGLLVFIHEWGHFIVARICGVKVETFSIGFGPKLFSKKWGDTNYCLSLIPLGGYVKMFGDEASENKIPVEEQSQSFNHQSLMEKIAIVSAGPLLNLIFAFVLFCILGLLGIPKIQPTLGDIDIDSPAHQSGLRYGDTILSVNGVSTSNYSELATALNSYSNQDPVRLKILRDGESLDLLAPITQEKNQNPLTENKFTNQINGLSLMRVSNKIGISHSSPLIQKGASSLEVISRVNGQKTPDLHSIKKEIANTPPNKPLKVSIQKNKGESIDLLIYPQDTAWSFASAGFVEPELIIGKVQSGSPADRAGLKSGDQILAVNGQSIQKWEQIVKTIKANPENKQASLEIGNKNGVSKILIQPKMTELLTLNGQVEYRPTIGIMSALELLPPVKHYVSTRGLSETLSHGFKETYKWTLLTLRGFKKLFTGEVSHKTLSGVISIGKVAKDSLSIGWVYFLQMMAIISINLFLLNLLPVPVLDGGHILFYLVELVKGSPVSLKTKLIGQQVGLVVILSLVAYTIFNDLTRIVFSGW